MSRLSLPLDLERRLRRLEARQEVLAGVLGVELDDAELRRSAGVRLDMPSTWAKYQAHVRLLADEADA